MFIKMLPEDGGLGGIDNLGGGTYDGGGVQSQGQQQSINPSWNEYLAEIPQELHEKVIPAFQKWDSGVQNMVQKVHSEYEPWKPFISATDPQTANWALQVLNAIENDPKTVYDALNEYYKFNEADNPAGSATEQGRQEPGLMDNLQDHPMMKQMQTQLQTMANLLMQQKAQEMEAQEDARLSQELAAAEKKFGKFDEEYVIAKLMANPNATVESAVQAYHQWAQNQSQTYRPRPLVMGAGGGIPGNNTDVRKLDSAGARDMIQQMLTAHKSQQQ